jgi:pyruvate/2-oxoglutarate dehydrogenase complex dihydrolipoamide acyltransferase (E2) component
MPFFVKAACKALETYPVVNAGVDGETIVSNYSTALPSPFPSLISRSRSSGFVWI